MLFDVQIEDLNVSYLRVLVAEVFISLYTRIMIMDNPNSDSVYMKA